MILDVFQCSQLFSDVFSWVVTFLESLAVQCITTPCALILWSSLYEVWQDQDASVGYQIGPNLTTNTGGHWETMSSSFSISFGSSKSVYAFYYHRQVI